MAFNFSGARKQAEAEGLLGKGDYVKLQEGDNRMRLMSECVAHPGTFQGKPNFKWLCYVVDRRDQRLKAFFMGHTVYKQLEALQMNEDYAFVDVPMPYDITIHATKAGTKDAKYVVLPARKEISVTALEIQALAEAKPIAELEKVLREKEKAASVNGPHVAPRDEPPPYPDDDGHEGPIDESDVPF